MESVYSVSALPVSWARVDREFASVPRRTRYPLMLASSGSIQLRATLSWFTSEAVSPVGPPGAEALPSAQELAGAAAGRP